jgi:nucleotide-binding universal stress UspA family protein
VPVLQVEGSPPADRPKTALVVGFDQTAASLAALGKAAEIGAQLQARLHVIHAVDLADYPVDPDADDWEEQAAKSLEEERQRVSAALAEYPCGWSFVALRADPAEALNRTAEEVDAVMIVVGVRSHGWRHIFERLAGPSVSHRLINHCHRPVLVVSYDQAS